MLIRMLQLFKENYFVFQYVSIEFVMYFCTLVKKVASKSVSFVVIDKGQIQKIIT